MNKLIFCIKVGVPVRSELLQWGDYHFAHSLGESLKRRGHTYFIQILPEWDSDADIEADIVVHLRGLSAYKVKPHHFNIIWNISHPEKVAVEEYNKYDLVLVASHQYAGELGSKVSVPVRPLLQFVDTQRFFPEISESHRSELLFVGNSRGVMRHIVRDAVSSSKPLTVYGSGWNQFLPKGSVKAEYFPNEQLRVLYSSAQVVLNDHWEDMRKFGFINNRVFDVLACKGTLISDEHDELKNVFPDVITYRNSQHLYELIDYIYSHPEEHQRKLERQYRDVIQNHSADRRVDELLSLLTELNLQKNVPKEKQKKTLKKRINQILLSYLGYGKTYRALHRSYMALKKSRRVVTQVKANYKRAIKKIFGNPGLDTLLNMTSEVEVTALATRVATTYNSISNVLVSIIIPTKNGIHHLRRLIPKLFNNTLYNNYEVLIIDNDSKDGTKSYIEGLNYTNVRYINTGKNLNFSQTINLGVSSSRGDVYVFLNNDVIPLFGWLDEMLRVFESGPEIGVVGSRLIYNSLNKILKHGEVLYPGCSVQHDGIRFQWTPHELVPINTGKYTNPVASPIRTDAEEVPAVTAACLMTDRETFQSVNGFEEKYQFGQEDTDYCIKVQSQGKQVWITRKSLLFHREFGTQSKKSRRNRKIMRFENNKIFNDRWYSQVSKKFWTEKLLKKESKWSETPFHLCFLVTENNPRTTAGDLFSARGLGDSLSDQFGYHVSYLPKRPNYEWAVIPQTADMVIVMRHDCDLRQLIVSKSTLKVAWVRGYVKEWLNSSWLNQYDGVIFSTNFAMQQAQCLLRPDQVWGVVPLGISPDFIHVGKLEPGQPRNIDVSFVGNIFEVPRDIVTSLDLNQGFNFEFYGRLETSKNHPWERYHKGSVSHEEVSHIYRKSKIVIEDTASFNKGTINLRVFEAAACGALVIANETIGLEEMLGESVLIYRDRDHLTSLIKYYLNHEQERLEKAERAQKIVFERHLFTHRAVSFKEILINRLLGAYDGKDIVEL